MRTRYAALAATCLLLAALAATLLLSSDARIRADVGRAADRADRDELHIHAY